VVLLAYYLGARVVVSSNAPSHEIGQTMAFLLLGLSSVLHLFVVRSRKTIFYKGAFANKRLWINAAISFALFCIIVATPGLNTILNLTNLDWQHWLITFGLCITPLLFAEYGKFWDNYRYNTVEKNRIDTSKIG